MTALMENGSKTMVISEVEAAVQKLCTLIKPHASKLKGMHWSSSCLRPESAGASGAFGFGFLLLFLVT